MELKRGRWIYDQYITYMVCMYVPLCGDPLVIQFHPYTPPTPLLFSTPLDHMWANFSLIIVMDADFVK